MSFKKFIESELLKRGYNNHVNGKKNWERYLGEDNFINILLKLFIEWEELKSKNI